MTYRDVALAAPFEMNMHDFTIDLLHLLLLLLSQANLAQKIKVHGRYHNRFLWRCLDFFRFELHARWRL